MKGATTLLYIGPLFAGLSGLGWEMVGPFVAVFVIWLMILRPEQWPASVQEWLTAPALGAALAQVLSQILLVAVLIALGRGFGAVSGFMPVVNPIFPIAVSFLAIPLCRVLWDAREAADRGVFLDEEAEAAQAPRAAAEAGSAIVPLLNLADDAPDSTTTADVSRILGVAGAELRLNALTAALRQPDRSNASLRRALVLWASEPEIVAPGRVPTAMANAFEIARHDPDLLRLYAPRALALIGAFPDRAEGFPAPADLRAAAADEPGANPDSDLPAHLLADLREGLNALALAVEKALDSVPPSDDLPQDPVDQSAASRA
ncbi:MAG: hypothetical protein C0524_09180 [Rhodobacter sp.]|nr:hypothetical protein [Rhodobacter sp.]